MDSYRKRYVGKIHTTDIKDTYGGGCFTICHGYLFCRQDTSAHMADYPRLRGVVSRCYFSLEVVAEHRYRNDDFLCRSARSFAIIS